MKAVGMRRSHTWNEVRKLSLRVIISDAGEDEELEAVACDANMRVVDVGYAIEFAVNRARENDRRRAARRRIVAGGAAAR